MQLVDHPFEYTCGQRVLFLKGRKKDGCDDQRIFSRHTSDRFQFAETLLEFREMAQPGERIYASAAARDIDKAIRKFKHDMLDNDYQHVTERNDFFVKIKDRWISCLMQPNCALKSQAKWLFDCDTHEQQEAVQKSLMAAGRPDAYWYKTKNGCHAIVSPYNTGIGNGLGLEGVQSFLDRNPLMLWGW